MFHELVHATGHPSRLNRSTLTDLCLFGDPTYAKGLVAEMGAAYLCGVCGIANATLDNSAAYLQSWMRVLRYDPTLLVQAAARPEGSRLYPKPPPRRAPRTCALIPRPVLGTVHVAPTPQRPHALKAKSKSVQRDPGQGPPHAPPQPSDGRDDHGNCTTHFRSLRAAHR